MLNKSPVELVESFVSKLSPNNDYHSMDMVAMPIIPAFRRQTGGNRKFQASLSYIVRLRPCLKHRKTSMTMTNSPSKVAKITSISLEKICTWKVSIWETYNVLSEECKLK